MLEYNEINLHKPIIIEYSLTHINKQATYNKVFFLWW